MSMSMDRTRLRNRSVSGNAWQSIALAQDDTTTYVELSPSRLQRYSHGPRIMTNRTKTILFALFGVMVVAIGFSSNALRAAPVVRHWMRPLNPEALDASREKPAPLPGCDPFRLLGSLVASNPPDGPSLWVPWNSSCPPSDLFRRMITDEPGKHLLGNKSAGSAHSINSPPASWTSFDPTNDDLSWLVNRTVVLHGDSIDRYHLLDFCEFAGGQSTLITHDHRASPPPPPPSPMANATFEEFLVAAGGDEELARKKQNLEAIREHHRIERWEKISLPLTRPWLCRVEKWGFTVVSVFTFGMGMRRAEMEFFGWEAWYHPPINWDDRLTLITKPLLDGLARNLSAPHVAFPDLVEINSNFWDARVWSEADFAAAGLSRPYDDKSLIPYQELSEERTTWWKGKMKKAVRHVARVFPGNPNENGRFGIQKGEWKPPKILWRSAHQVQRHVFVPHNRAFVLDQLARHNIRELQEESRRARRMKEGHDVRGGDHAAEDSMLEDLRLDKRLDIDESGALILGQEHRFRDFVHPLPTPGSWLWADIILFELRRAVTGYPSSPS